jgi:hypothetical protein
MGWLDGLIISLCTLLAIIYIGIFDSAFGQRVSDYMMWEWFFILIFIFEWYDRKYSK